MQREVGEEGFKALGSMRPSHLSGTWALSPSVLLWAEMSERLVGTRPPSVSLKC